MRGERWVTIEGWTERVIRARWLVLLGWLLLLVLSVAVVSQLGDLLTNRFTLPGTDTNRVATILEEEFGQRPIGSFTLVAEAEDGVSSAALLEPLRAAARRAEAALPTGKLAYVSAASGSVANALVTSTLRPARAKEYTDELREAVGDVPGARVYVTGQAAIEHDLEPVQEADLFRGEVLIAIPIALLILIFVFGTLGFLIPFMFAAAAIPTTLGAVWIFANFMELSTYVQNLVMLIGLAVSVDYSLLVVYRYREERRAGAEKHEAIVRTMATAGRSVVFSGTAVAIGLALLVVMPLPFVRGFGVAGLLIPLVSVACALTLLPVLLYLIGDRLERVRLVPAWVAERRVNEENNFWARLARAIMRRPVLFLTVSVALLVSAAVPVYDLELGPGTNQGIPQDLESTIGLNILSEAAGAGALAPTELVVDSGRPDGLRDTQLLAAVERLREGVAADPQVRAVRFGFGPGFADESGRYLHLQVIGEKEYGDPASMDFAKRLRSDIVPDAAFPADVDVLAGGGPPSSVDFIDLTYGAFPWLVAGVLVLTYLLLMRAFRSLLLPLKAILLNLLSIAAAYGLLVIVFKWGGGSVLGLISFDQIEAWIPVFLFAMLFGLSMDYEVFLVSRMREEWDKHGDNERAVAVGLAKTGRQVTAAGMIMFAAFMGFVVGSILGLQQFGFGLAAAILIDVTIVRALLLPSAMKLFGRWNWWLPDSVARVARVEPSPLRASARAGA